MSQLEEIEQDVLDFLSKVDNLSDNDRKQLLMLLFNKHLILNKSNVMISYNDFQYVLNLAKKIYSEESFPIKIEDDKKVLREVPPSEVGHYCLMESVICLLNKKEALKKLPVFKKWR
jgi:hypothetical protein